ncbi:MAG: PAS-domain containing protein, partial [Elusimicrobia bacterium]|nr:PAS-domain containing protein [Elusimicrobiota bacterium]
MPRRLPANLRQALSLAEAALEATADGLLFVNRRGRITGFNRRFVRMWRLPKRVVDSHDDAKAIAFVLGQLRDPGAFGARIRALYSRPRQESFDVIDFKDGRVFERYSRPQVIGARVVGRVWSFRDVTQARQLERDLAEISGREQAKLSRELHDTVAQTLTAISLLARAGVSRNADKPVADRFRRIDQLGRTGLSQVRTTARGLMPPELEKADLESSLKTLESTARELFGIACSVSVRGDARIAEPGAAVE